MAACILGGSGRKEFKGTHTTHWLRLRPHAEGSYLHTLVWEAYQYYFQIPVVLC